MMGKAANQHFVFQGRDHKVLQIENKIVYRARQCLEGFEQTFPTNTAFRRFTVETAPQHQRGSEEGSLASFINFWKMDTNTRRIFKMSIRKNGMPITKLAQEMGKSIIETMGHLAANRNLGIRCSPFDNTFWIKAGQTISETKKIVLDGTAIATIFMLDFQDQLRNLPFQCIVPDAAIQELRELKRRFDRNTDNPIYLGFQDGRPVFNAASREQEIAFARQLARLITVLENDCLVVGGSAIVKLPTAHRNALFAHFGIGLCSCCLPSLMTKNFRCGPMTMLLP